MIKKIKDSSTDISIEDGTASVKTVVSDWELITWITVPLSCLILLIIIVVVVVVKRR